jgi:hypothetical protein
MDVVLPSAWASVLLAAQLGFGLLWLTSGVSKLRNLHAFAAGLRQYDLLPPAWVPLSAWFIPIVECGLALFFLVGRAVPMAAFISAGLLLIFSSAVIVNLRRGRRIPCHCHGLVRSPAISWGLVVRNAGLVLTGLVLLNYPPQGFAVTFSVLGWLVIALIAASWWLLLHLVHSAIDVVVSVHHTTIKS